MKRVTGIGGLFIKAMDVPKLKDWYREHLGFMTTEWGATFVWGDPDPGKQTVSRTEWSLFPTTTAYFGDGGYEYMLNYRVENLESLMETLKEEGVEIAGAIEKFDYGKFGWIVDPEKRKIELWEPVDNKLGDDPQPWSGHVTGLGGVFFRSANPETLMEWYEKHLGFGKTPFQWHDLTNPAGATKAQTIWMPFKESTSYFDPVNKSFMINYRVRDLNVLLEELRQNKIEVVGEVEEHPYGKFGWILDPEGTKVELWEPVDDGF